MMVEAKVIGKVGNFQIRAYVAVESDDCENCQETFAIGDTIYGLHERDGRKFDPEVTAVACSCDCARTLAEIRS